MKKRVMRIVSACFFLVVHSAANAVPLASENFNYPNGPIAGQNGGSGWGGAWSGGAVVSGGVLDNTGNNLLVGNFRDLGSSIAHTAGTSIYVRFDMSADASGNNDFAGFSFFNGGSEEVFFGLTFDRNAYGASWTGRYGGTFAGIAVTGAVDTLVGEILFGTVNSTINLYVNPGSTLGPADDTFTFLTADLGGSWNRVRVFGASTLGGIGTFDNILIATSAADVAAIPEPSTYALLAIGLAVLGWRCRRT